MRGAFGKYFPAEAHFTSYGTSIITDSQYGLEPKFLFHLQKGVLAPIL